MVAVEPDFTVRIVINHGLKEGRGELVVKVDCADYVCHWFGGFSEEQRHIVVGVKDSVDAQLLPGVLKVGDGHPPFFLFDVRVTLEEN